MSRCPRCAAALAAPADASTARACPAGHGSLVAREELARALPPTVVADFEAAMARAPRGGPACPACRATMHVGPVGEAAVEVDACVRCGALWLDAGEMERLRAAVGVRAKRRPREGIDGFLVLETLAELLFWAA